MGLTCTRHNYTLTKDPLSNIYYTIRQVKQPSSNNMPIYIRSMSCQIISVYTDNLEHAECYIFPFFKKIASLVTGWLFFFFTLLVFCYSSGALSPAGLSLMLLKLWSGGSQATSYAPNKGSAVVLPQQVGLSAGTFNGRKTMQLEKNSITS